MWAEYAQNSLTKPATGMTPFKCILGFQPPMFPWSGEPTDCLRLRNGCNAVRSLGPSSTHLYGQSGVRNFRLTDIDDQVPSTSQGMGLALDPRSSPPTSMQETQSQVCWTLQNFQTNHPCIISVRTAL